MNIDEIQINTPFIRKLNNILTDPIYAQIITWDQTGTMIDILDEKKIQTEILPKYFRHSKFQSFIRQLNLYGFKKMKNKDCHRFRHPDLVKGNSLFSIKSQRKFKNSLHQSKIQSVDSQQQSANLQNENLIRQNCSEKSNQENEKFKKNQIQELIENRNLNYFQSQLNLQTLYQNMVGMNQLSYCQPYGQFNNFGLQTVYLPNLNNILFYN